MRHRKTPESKVREMDAYWDAIRLRESDSTYRSCRALVRPFLEQINACIDAREAINLALEKVEAAHKRAEDFLSDKANLEILRRAGANVARTPYGGIVVGLDGRKVTVDDWLKLKPKPPVPLPGILSAAGVDAKPFEILSTPRIIEWLLRSGDPKATQVLTDLKSKGMAGNIKRVRVEKTGSNAEDTDAPSQTD